MGSLGTLNRADRLSVFSEVSIKIVQVLALVILWRCGLSSFFVPTRVSILRQRHIKKIFLLYFFIAAEASTGSIDSD